MGSRGAVVLELPPGAGNPRNSEGAFIRLKDGRLAFVYSRFVGESASDTAPSCIAARFSADGGRTWSATDEVLFTHAQLGARNVMSVSLLRMADGELGLFFLVRRGWHDCRLHLFRSADEGRSWSAPVLCVPAPGYYVTNNDRVVRLGSGRIVTPSAYHRMRGPSTEDWASFDGRGTAMFFLSDDDGRSWREARQCCTMPHPRSRSGLQETGVLELAGGVLWAFFRTDLGCHYESWSLDGGESWTEALPSRFSGPCSPLSAKRIGDGRLIAVWNPVPMYQTRDPAAWCGGRSPLAAAISADDGRSWAEPFLIEDGSDGGGYCYTAIHAEPDAVLLAYGAGTPADGSCLGRLRVRRLPVAELG